MGFEADPAILPRTCGGGRRAGGAGVVGKYSTVCTSHWRGGSGGIGVNRWSKVFLIALRIAVGWHFLYEGLWKIDSDTGTTSYATAWYTLQSSVGRLREYYESSGPAAGRGPGARRPWYDEIVKSFKARNKPLADDQKARLR